MRTTMNWIEQAVVYVCKEQGFRNQKSEWKRQNELRFDVTERHRRPADIAKRGTTVSELEQNKLWWFGPSWFNQDVQSWPSFDRRKDTAQPEEASSDDQKHKASKPVLVTTEGEQQTSSPPCSIDIGWTVITIKPIVKRHSTSFYVLSEN